MASTGASKKLIISTLIFSVISFGCLLAGITGNVWWIKKRPDYTKTQGLWRTCIEYKNSTDCNIRTDIFKFTKDQG